MSKYYPQKGAARAWILTLCTPPVFLFYMRLFSICIGHLYIAVDYEAQVASRDVNCTNTMVHLCKPGILTVRAMLSALLYTV